MDREAAERLFEEVVETTGVSRIIARVPIERSLAAVGAMVETASAEDYIEAMPQLRAKLGPFLDEEALLRLDRLHRRLMIRTGMISARIAARLKQVPRAPSSVNRVVRGTRGQHRHATFVLHGSALLGRAAAADIQILDQHVSRQHARLSVERDGSVALVDLSSHNGTFVGGGAVERHALRSGDAFQIGTAEYVYEETAGPVETSEAFRNKLTDTAPLGPLISRKVAAEILNSRTAEMPPAQDDPEGGSSSTRETETVRGPMGHRRLSDTPTRDSPSISLRPLPSVARDPALTERPPRRKRRTQSDLEVIAAPSPGSYEIQVSNKERAAARTAVDAVLRFRALLQRETSGEPMRIEERSGLRHLESTLRTGSTGTATAGKDRRRWMRMPCRHPVLLGETRTPGTLLDISGGGLSISCPTLPVAPGDAVGVRIRLDEERVAVFRTKVAWTDPDDGTFGACFTGVVRWEMTA